MLKLLIADASREFTGVVAQEFRKDFSLQICHDGIAALQLLEQFQPDVFVLNLSLPFKDGLTVLQEATFRPRVIVAISTVSPFYVQHRAQGLGIQLLLVLPTVSSLRLRVMNILRETEEKQDISHQVAAHLRTLGFRPHLDGYRQLCVGIPIFAQNPRMLLSKELYPAISELFRLPDSRAVEHSIRKAISDAWQRRDPAIWGKYFPCTEKPPNNKAFLCRILEMLDL